jgi:hypothetical protein
MGRRAELRLPTLPDLYGSPHGAFLPLSGLPVPVKFHVDGIGPYVQSASLASNSAKK